MVKRQEATSPLLKNCVMAFLFGGTLCAVAEALILTASAAGMPDKDARLCASLALIAISVLLTGLNVYDDIARHAGAGTLVPITGFANAMASPAMEFKAEGLVLGMAAKLFSIAGPVLVYGISASVVYGLILQIITVVKG